MWKWMIVVGFISASMVSVCRAEETVLWKADLSQVELGKPPAGFDEQCAVREEDGKRYLAFTKEKDSAWVMGTATAAANPAKWEDYDFRLTLRFKTANPTTYLVVKAQGARPKMKYLWYYVELRKEVVNVKLMGVPKGQEAEAVEYEAKKYSDAGLEPLKEGEWYPFVIRVKGDTIAILRGKDGKMVEVAKYDVIPGSGGVRILSYTSVDVANLEVVALPKDEPAAAPKTE